VLYTRHAGKAAVNKLWIRCHIAWPAAGFARQPG
jgi:hypothetical protein